MFQIFCAMHLFQQSCCRAVTSCTVTLFQVAKFLQRLLGSRGKKGLGKTPLYLTLFGSFFTTDTRNLGEINTGSLVVTYSLTIVFSIRISK